METVTINTILDQFKEWVEKKIPIDPHLWVDSSRKLNVLIGDEQEKLYDLEHSMANFRLGLIENKDVKMSMTEIKLRAEASPIYRDIQNLKAKIGRVQEHIRIAKLQARLSSDEIRHQ